MFKVISLDSLLIMEVEDNKILENDPFLYRWPKNDLYTLINFLPKV